LSRFAVDTRVIDYLVQRGDKMNHITLEKVPSRFIYRPFGQLFVHFIKNRGRIAIGVYRYQKVSDETQLGEPAVLEGSDVVISCPPRSLILQETDMVYTILSCSRTMGELYGRAASDPAVTSPG